MKKLSFLLFILIGLIVWQHDLLYNLIEGQNPEIVVTSEMPRGLGVAEQEIEIRLFDRHAGLKDVTVALVQGENSFELYQQDFPPASAEEVFTVSLPGSKLNLSEGEAEIKIVTRDRSLRTNTAEQIIKLPVDRQMPQLAILSQQHVGSQGGAEFVIFRANDQNIDQVGVKVGQHTFKAIRAWMIDPRFKDHDNIYVALFAIPFGFSREQDGEIQAFAKDGAGNIAQSPLTFRIASFNQADVTPNLSDNFLDRIIPRLLPQYGNQAGVSIEPQDRTTEGRLENFRLINEELRKLNDEVIQEVTSKFTPERYWDGEFKRAMAGSISSNLGEKRYYKYQEQDASHSVHLGLDIASVVSDVVRAAHNGRVAYTGDLGIYGNTVIIDHGLGLFTLYSHLSSIEVSEDQMVEQEESIARSGETGLAGGDHLHFEFRLGTLPVTPIEWWDAKWIQDNIDGKLDLTYQSLTATTNPATGS